MKIDPKNIYAVTYSTLLDKFESVPLSTWLDHDMKLFIERTTPTQGYLLLSVHDSYDEAQARMNQLLPLTAQ